MSLGTDEDLERDFGPSVFFGPAVRPQREDPNEHDRGRDED
jgi:hypothetical protein